MLSLVKLENTRLQNQQALLDASNVRSQIAQLQQLLTDRETGQRGYLVTGSPLFLQPYFEAEASIDEVLTLLEGSFDARAWSRLNELVDGQQAHLQETIELADRGDTQTAQSLTMSGRGKAIMDEVRSIALDGLSRYEVKSVETGKSLQNWTLALNTLLYLSALVVAFLILLPAIFLQRNIVRPLNWLEIQLQKFAAAEIDKVDRVQTRIDEIRQFSNRITTTAAALKKTELDLQETTNRSHDYLSGIIDAVPDALIITDDQAHIVRCNSDTESLFGYSQSELIGQPVEILLPEDLRVTHKALREEFLKKPKDRPMGSGPRFVGLAKDGTRLPLAISLNLFASSEGKQIILSLRDVSEIRNTQRLLEKTVEDLKDLETKRNQIFGMVAHELRTPVAAISMMADQHDDTEWLRDRKSLRRTVNDLLNTIDDMRLVINPDLKRPIRSEAFTVQELNASVAANVASIVSSSGVQYEQSNAIPFIFKEAEFRSDTYRVRVAITNIVKNACLHSRGTKVWMVSRLYMGRDGQQYLEWLVKDDGLGIPEDQLDRLFEAGERGDSKADGSGLGLFISKSWIEEIGGEIGYQRARGGGSSFSIRIPLLNSIDSGLTEIKETDNGNDLLDSVLANLNILLVEDETMLRMLGQKLLLPLVHDVQVASNGMSGLADFDPEYHDLLLTDNFMPEMSGVELISKLRASGYSGPIVGVTAATIGEQSQDMLVAGADIVLPKPLTKALFRQTVAELMALGHFERSTEDGTEL